MPGSSCSSAEKELQSQESCSGPAFRSLLVEALSRVLGDHWVGELPPLLTSSKGRVEWLFSARLLQSPDNGLSDFILLSWASRGSETRVLDRIGESSPLCYPVPLSWEW